MARTFCSGFETNDFTGGASGGRLEASGRSGASTTTYDTSIVRTGTYSAKVVLASAATGYMAPRNNDVFGAFVGQYARVYMRVTARPATTARQVFGNIGAGQDHLKLNANGTLAIYNNTTLVGTSTTALTDTARWYRVEINSNAGDANGVLFIDGSLEVAGTGTGNTLQPFCGAFSDTVADTYTVYFDDIAFDNAALPGDGKVVLLRPISDNAGGTGWTLGTGTALGGNGFNAVDNLPPVGVVDLGAGSDAWQIRNAASAANSNMDFNMTSYATAGIQVGDVVKAVRPMVVTAAPVTTSSKQGTVGVVSNPTIANIALNTVGTAGAFWNGTTAGTYPTGWKANEGTFTTSPSVTLGTSPVMRIAQVTSSTRIAMVCWMGMYVEYLPGSRYPKARESLQHINRASSF